jgi:hypothetical protein
MRYFIISSLKSVLYGASHGLSRAIGGGLALTLVMSLAACSTGGEYIVTLAKLHNLRVTMSIMTTYHIQSSDDFPKNPDEIIDFMIADAGISVPNREEDNPFTDGWGNQMILKGDLKRYEIRSAGPDEELNTDDDIYLEGNSHTEYVIDGVKEKNASVKSLMSSPIKVAYQEPNGYYKFALPGKYAAIDNQKGWTSDITFRYTASNTVTVVADPAAGRRDPAQEMDKRVRKLKGGRDESLAGYTVTESKLVKIDQALGFTIALECEGCLARVYELTSREGITYSITIRSSGEERQYIMDTLCGAVSKGLDLR